jgi:hypothetical protein
MPVDTKHPEYERMAGRWKIMRDTAEGQHAIHSATLSPGGALDGSAPIGFTVSPGSFTVVGSASGAQSTPAVWLGEAYLPRLHKEEWCDYRARRDRANFFNATARTIEGLVGMLFRKDPEYKVSPVTEPMLGDVTKTGVNLSTFASEVADEVMTVRRVGIMVDYPRAPTDDNGQPIASSVAAAEAQRLQPQMALYKTEAIINWGYEWIQNQYRLTLVVLQYEEEIDDPDDEFSNRCETRWRVLDLVEYGAEGEPMSLVYRVRVFNKREGTGKDKGKKFDNLVSEDVPLMNGAPLSYVPFRFVGTADTEPVIQSPDLLDLAYVNLSHYTNTADIEHGAHQTSLPQPWITGVTQGIDANGVAVDPDYYIGGGMAWTFQSTDSQVGMLEYTGQGLQALADRLAAKERQMAVLGARMLEAQKSGVESADTAGIHRSGEQSALQRRGRNIAQGIKVALGWFDAWAGGTGDVEFTINMDFFPLSIDAPQLTALVGAWQAGAMSKEALFETLQKGEVISDARKFEIEEAKIANEPPALSAPASAPGAAKQPPAAKA